jgi:predicted Ser/Thr protein kinase
LADTDLTLALHHPQLRTFSNLAVISHRAYFTAASISGLVAIYLLASPWGPAFANAHADSLWVIAYVIAGLILFGFLVNVARSACSSEMIVNRDGLNLPLMVARLNNVKIWQSWAGVTNASIANNESNERCLLLQLKSGKSIVIPLGDMEPQAVEQLLLSIELWGTNCERTQSLLDYQAEVHNQSKGLSQLSYTDMWNEELGRRFTSTTFIPLEPGTVLQNGRLTVLRQLAFGGLSAIYLVQDGHKEMRILKEAVVPSAMEVKNRDAAEKALQREATILANLTHPNIVTVLDHFVESEHHYLVLNHIAGQDLRQLVRQNGAQAEAKVLDWAMQISSALEYLHTYNPPIIHRDLTPENIVLKNDGTVVIIDFGASNQFLGTMTGTIIGKQAYMAPEQLQGKATNQSDIYAFGGTLYFLLTGKDPVPLSESHPADLVPVSDTLNEFIGRCTNLDTDARYTSVTDLRVQLTELYSQQGIAKLFTET